MTIEKEYTFKEVMDLSLKYYKKAQTRRIGNFVRSKGRGKGDDKKLRAILDVKRARITKRERIAYNRSTKQWEQAGRNIKIELLISTNPISYRKQDNIKLHKYPITFIIMDIDKGIDSPIRWRTGSLFKPKISKGKTSKDKRQKIADYNIKKGIQMQFFFELEWVLKMNGLLYGRNWATRPPKIANPRKYIFFDKHAFFCAKKLILPLLTTKKGLLQKLVNDGVL